MAGKSNSKLTDGARTYIVQALACWDTPTHVANTVKREFGISITPQAIEAYDPTKQAGRNLSEKWQSLFEATREELLKDKAKIPISHRGVRLRALQRMLEKAEAAGNILFAAQLLEQAAKEVGGMFTNRRELTGNGGKDLPAGPSVLQVIIDGAPALTTEADAATPKGSSG